ncbi:MAG: AraC family transcriptional regulator [Polyangiales bacterium]
MTDKRARDEKSWVADEATTTHVPVTLGRAPVLRSRMAPLFLARLVAQGGDVTDLLREFALPSESLRLPELHLPLPKFRELTDRIAERLDDPRFGLHAAVELPPGAYGITEFLLRSSPTPRAALRQLLDFVPLFNSLLQLSLTEDGDTAIVEGRIPGERSCLGRHGNEFVLAVFVRLGRQLAGEEWAPEHISFAHPRSTGIEELAGFFKTRSLSFDSGHLGLRFGAADLARRVPTEDSALHDFLEREARAAVARLATDDLEPVREAIRVSLPTGGPTAEGVARTVGASVRTLQRRLLDQGTTLRQITDEVRAGLAHFYMIDHARPLKDVAAQLGYADVRAFSRAFKRWTGRSPGDVGEDREER